MAASFTVIAALTKKDCSDMSMKVIRGEGRLRSGAPLFDTDGGVAHSFFAPFHITCTGEIFRD